MKKMRNDSSKLERHHIANEVKPVDSFVYKGIKIAADRDWETAKRFIMIA